MKKTAVFLAAALWSFSGVLADGNLEKAGDKQELRQDGRTIAGVKACIAKLSQTIDLWHQANINNRTRLANEREKEIFDLIDADLRSNASLVMACQREVERSEREAESPHATVAGTVDDRRDWRDDRADLKKMEGLLKAKERLYASLRKSQSFSGKYRLLGDYLELLKREVRAEKIEVAEDVRELKER